MRINGKPCRVHAEIDGKTYEVGPVKASEAEKLLAWTGFSKLAEWEVKVTDGDPLACRALLALVEFRKGNHVRMADVEIQDVDTCTGELRDDAGRVAELKMGDDGKPVIVKGEVVWEFDGEPVDPPMPQSSPTD